MTEPRRFKCWLPLRLVLSLWLLGASCFAQIDESVRVAESPRRVLLAGSLAPEVRSRINGYLSATSWQTLELPVEIESTESATAVARQHDARAVVWVTQPTESSLELHVVDMTTSTQAKRVIPIEQPQDPLSRSAAYETLALVVHVTLQSAEHGVEIGARTPPQVTPTPATSPADSPPRAPAASNSVALRVHGGWRAYLDSGNLRHGPELAVGVAGEAWWVVGSGAWLLPRRVTTTVDGSDATPIAFNLQEATLGVVAGHEFVVAGEWLCGLGAAGALTVVQRQRASVSQSLSAEREHRTLAPQLDAFAQLVSPRLFVAGPRVLLLGGASAYLRRPRWLLESGQALDQQWSTLQPWLAVSLRFDWGNGDE